MAAASQHLSDAIVAFSLDGSFPDDVAQLPPVSGTDLGPAIEALQRAKLGLEAEVHSIHQETKDDVSAWVSNARTLQDDIIRSKAIANDILRQAEAPDVSGQSIQDAETKAGFLNREVQYTQQLHDVLRRLQHATRLLADVERAKDERRILDSLRLLEQSWTALDQVGISKSCRVMRLLDVRSFELKSDVHEVLDHVWKALIRVDVDAGKVVIFDALDGESLSLHDAVVGLKAYKEVDERMEQLWRNVDAAVVSSRMDSSASSIPAIKADADELRLEGQTEASVDALMADLETVFVFLSRKLPSDLLPSLSSVMMGDVVPRLIQQWLNPAVPTSLRGMKSFQEIIRRTSDMCTCLTENGYTGLDELSDWAGKAPATWLAKCRETALDTVRTRLAAGIGESRRVERIEKHMVSLSEGKELAAAADANDWGEDWGDAWDDEANNNQSTQDSRQPQPQGQLDNSARDDGADAWGWDEDEAADKPMQEAEPAAKAEARVDDDDSTEAWGWGDEEAAVEPAPATQKSAVPTAPREETRELVLKETYHISSMPEPVLELIFTILEDGAALTREGDEYELVASTAPGLFSLPTFALALFRAISPYYYSLDVGGNMFLYNDAMYIADRLTDLSTAWKQRDDLTLRARSMLRLDNDIKTLQSFANRSYGSEMNVQKTVLQDLLGGSQSLMQQDDMEDVVESGKARVRTMAATWEPILARSAWWQAVGSLADALAARLITDVLDMASIGQDEAYRIAKLIASATELDDLFLPSKPGPGEASEDEVPTTAQYAPNWLRLKYLAEVLQSNLNEVKFLWCDSELSLYFTLDEVVDLIKASFEDNARTRETIREIRSRPQPMAGRDA